MKNARSRIERARFVDRFVFVITLSKAALGRGGDAGPSDGGQGRLPGLLHGDPPPVCGRGNGHLGIYPGGDPGRGERLGIQPAHKRLSFTGVGIDKVVDGKIVEHGGAVNTFETLYESRLIGPV